MRGGEVAQAGGAAGVLPFAQNDMPGTWTVIFRDIVTGQTYKKEITLQ